MAFSELGVKEFGSPFWPYNSLCDLGHISHFSWASVSPSVDQEFGRKVYDVPFSPDCL